LYRNQHRLTHSVLRRLGREVTTGRDRGEEANAEGSAGRIRSLRLVLGVYRHHEMRRRWFAHGAQGGLEFEGAGASA